MTTLFHRAMALTIDTVKLVSGSVAGEPDKDSLRVKFEIIKSLKPEPNKSHVSVYNFNPSRRLALEQLTKAAVLLEAGYKDGTSVICFDNLRTVVSRREGADIITSIGGGDGEKQIRQSRVSVSVAKGAPTDQVLQQVALAIGVDKGNLAQAAADIRTRFAGAGSVFTTGTVITGNAAREMTAICKSLNLEWSVQHNKLQILERGKALAGKAIFLTSGASGGANSGLIGVPSVDNKGILTCQMLMQPDVYPGRLLVLASENIKGQFRITDTTHKGDTHGTDAGSWSIECKAGKY